MWQSAPCVRWSGESCNRRYQDVRCGSPAKSRISSRVAVWISSATEVTSHEIIQSHLQGAAADLKEWASAQADSIPCDRIMDAVLAIQISATGVQAGDGDGPARCFATGPSPCLCGFLALAQLVEGHALACYLRAAEAANSAIHWPEVTYETKITPDDLNQLTPFKIGGEAARRLGLSLSPSRTKIFQQPICARWPVLFHEVVCHAFKAPHWRTPPRTASHSATGRKAGWTLSPSKWK